jgi:hypothetical protein
MIVGVAYHDPTASGDPVPTAETPAVSQILSYPPRRTVASSEYPSSRVTEED